MANLMMLVIFGVYANANNMYNNMYNKKGWMAYASRKLLNYKK